MSTCTVSGVIKGADGSLRPGVVIGFYARVPIGANGAQLNEWLATVTTDDGGAFSTPLERTALVRVNCIALGLDALVIKIPDAATADFATLIAEALAEPPTPDNPFALEAELLAEVARAEGAETDIAGDLVNETNAREAADTVLQGHIDAEASTRSSAISSEATTRANADTANAGAISSEVARAEAAESALATVLAWMNLVSNLTVNPATPGSTFNFVNTIVRAYQFNLNGRMILSSDAPGSFSFTDTTDGTKYVTCDLSTARALVLRNIDGDPIALTVGTLALTALHFDANNSWASGSLSTQILIASLTLALATQSGGYVGFSSGNKAFNLLSDWSYGWLPTTNGNATDPAQPADTSLSRESPGVVVIKDGGGVVGKVDASPLRAVDEQVIVFTDSGLSSAIENSTRPTRVMMSFGLSAHKAFQIPAGLPYGKRIVIQSDGNPITNVGAQVAAGESINDGLTWSGSAGFAWFASLGGGTYAELTRLSHGSDNSLSWIVSASRGQSVTIDGTGP